MPETWEWLWKTVFMNNEHTSFFNEAVSLFTRFSNSKLFLSTLPRHQILNESFLNYEKKRRGRDRERMKEHY